MSTDMAFALGLLTLFGRRAPDRLRAFMLTVVIADYLLALVLTACGVREAATGSPSTTSTSYTGYT
jgi:Na+/H+ antiporter NhaA